MTTLSVTATITGILLSEPATEHSLPQECVLCPERHEEICHNCWARLTAAPRSSFIVRMRSEFAPAVHFHRNLCGLVYAVVPDQEASQFGSVAGARNAMWTHGLSPRHATIHPVNHLP